MLAIPHHSQVFSMAMIDSKEAQKKLKAGICFRISSHNKHTWFYLYKETQKKEVKKMETSAINRAFCKPCKGVLSFDEKKRVNAVRCTRPDVAFAQNITSRFQQNPGECHWTAMKNILKYLRNTKDMFLVYGGNPEAELRVDYYCNAGFEIDIDDMKSLT
ncbi:hypothetical protein Tco_1384332 [Tanacetum coccineum]